MTAARKVIPTYKALRLGCRALSSRSSIEFNQQPLRRKLAGAETRGQQHWEAHRWQLARVVLAATAFTACGIQSIEAATEEEEKKKPLLDEYNEETDFAKR